MATLLIVVSCYQFGMEMHSWEEGGSQSLIESSYHLFSLCSRSKKSIFQPLIAHNWSICAIFHRAWNSFGPCCLRKEELLGQNSDQEGASRATVDVEELF